MNGSGLKVWTGMASAKGVAALAHASAGAWNYLMLDCPDELSFQRFPADQPDLGQCDSGRAFGSDADLWWRRVDDLEWLAAAHEDLAPPSDWSWPFFSVVMISAQPGRPRPEVLLQPSGDEPGGGLVPPSPGRAAFSRPEVRGRRRPDLETLRQGEERRMLLFGTPLQRPDGWWWYEGRIGRPRRYPVDDPPSGDARWRAAITIVPYLDHDGKQRLARWRDVSIVDTFKPEALSGGIA